jgi:hypothetical protein
VSVARFHANGIDGATGAYLLPELTPAALAALARGEPASAVQAELRRRQFATKAHYGVPDGTDANSLAESGWGIVFARDADPAVREALAPLIEHRRAEAAAENAARFRVLAGSEGVQPGQSKNAFVIASGGVPAEVDPDRMPYYLLLVGSPEEIPFEFQYQLDVQHAVGRLHFAAPEDYARYAQGVVAAEQGAVRRERRMVLLGPRNPDDDATTLSADALLAGLKAAEARIARGWTLDTVLGADATKARLAAHLGGAETPAVLFTASHGMGFPSGHARQARHQGALLMQDWPGPVDHRGPVPESMYFSADDLGAAADVHGLIAFAFACYGAGTPQRDQFARLEGAELRELAPRPFVAPLAQALTSHPRGPALAFVGHVERAWGYSFYWPEAGAAIGAFRDALGRLARGDRVGHALDPLNTRHAALSTMVTDLLERIRDGYRADDLDAELARLWAANNDARNYVIVGDPAVRACVPPKGDPK